MRSIAEIRALFRDASPDELPGLISAFSSDDRIGVRALTQAAEKRLDGLAAERERVRALMQTQLTLQRGGFAVVAGVDEVGRGALAGPVTAAAVILEAQAHITGLDDSKRLTPSAREDVARRVHDTAIAISVTHVMPERIDSLGIAAANTLAMRSALESLDPQPHHVIADGLRVELGFPAMFVVGGDRLCGCVAAASVVAKVARDALMRELDGQYPGYGFAVNKGYGTREHIDAIRRLGASAVHRLSFAPCGQRTLF